jgi:asparagine synthase (glutamine-hydrolysing)
MCGIAGGIGVDAPNEKKLSAQLDSIAHRGPDDQGMFLSNGISLGMCRLAIVEISQGHQPLHDETNKIHIVWNGEIYNYVEIRTQLSTLGVKFRNSSESEVLLQAYLFEGLKFVKRLNGMFAIAISDERQNKLHLIRDRMGKKPIWYFQKQKTLLFASELKAIKIIEPHLTLRSAAISEVMQFGYIQPPFSAYEEIEQIPPASILTWDNGSITLDKYWEAQFVPKIEIDYNEALERTGQLVETAVKRRMISERPMGTFLSGGIDSSLVTALVAQNSNEKIKSFTIGFNDSQYDESRYAQSVAKHLDIEHHVEMLKPNPIEIMGTLGKLLELPFADSSIIPTYLVSKFARKEMVVSLTGDGGDEVFGGYNRYLAAPFLQRVNNIIGPLGNLVNKPLISKKLKNRNLIRTGQQFKRHEDLASRYVSIQRLVDISELNHYFTRDFFDNSFSNMQTRFFSELNDLSKLDKMVRSDLKYYLPSDILYKIDVASMMNSLEIRSPLLDTELVEFALRLPDSYKIYKRETKHILRELTRRYIPAELIDRPKKGFAIPRANWLRSELKQITNDLLTDSVASNRGWFDIPRLRQVIELHNSGQNLDNVIWPILVIEIWARNHLD